MSEKGFTDNRGVYLENSESHFFSDTTLYDVWVSKERQHTDYGWLGFVEAAESDTFFYAYPWDLPGGSLGPYESLEDATLTLLTWYKLRMEQGLWES